MWSVENNPFSLEGRYVLVTGASSGIGRAVAIACAQMGAHVTLTARNRERLEETLGMLAGDGHQVVVADLTVEADRVALAQQVPALDGVVQNAGVGSRVLCKDIEDQDILSVFAPNVFAPILLQKQLLTAKKMRKNASIVFVASMAAKYPSVGNAIYSASKGAVISYAKVLSLELAVRQIRVNCVCPAMVWTDFIMQEGIDREVLENAQLKYPLKRYGVPADVANACLYLLADASNWVTGTCLEVHGGASEL